jgi:hypothetical protein
LPLRLGAKMRAAFLKRRLNRSPLDEPSENLDWRRIEICAQDGLRVAYPLGLRASTQRTGAGGSTRSRFPSRFRECIIAIPAKHQQPGPARRFLFEHFGELEQRASILGRASALPRTAFRHWREEIRVKPQPGQT